MLIGRFYNLSKGCQDAIEFFFVLNSNLIIFFGWYFVKELNNTFEVSLKIDERSHHHVWNDSGTWKVVYLRSKYRIHFSLIRNYDFALSASFSRNSHICWVSYHILFTIVLCSSEVFYILCGFTRYDFIQIGSIGLLKQNCCLGEAK